jgi:hypothetical protein
MAQKTIVTLIDDLDGGEASETVSFGLDGVEYSIDLSGDNAGRLRAGLEEFVTNARRVGGRKTRVATTKTVLRAGGDKAQNQAIREWARGQGRRISDRGRIPSDLVTQFQAAHAS